MRWLQKGGDPGRERAVAPVDPPIHERDVGVVEEELSREEHEEDDPHNHASARAPSYPRHVVHRGADGLPVPVGSACGAAGAREGLLAAPVRVKLQCVAGPSSVGTPRAALDAPVLEAYAMTEAAHLMTSNPLPEDEVR
uniref:Uncharacterized protein n=1 Tax=Ananas comosus var. bracteatus TaxID=296719 RepID=A0A6V7QK34_ANACO|nr:unnamed protein product [Ananas comosus var. bracteatus]